MKKEIFYGFIVSIFCIVVADDAFSQCSCEPKLTLKEHFVRSEVVFVGKVIEVSETTKGITEAPTVIVKFEVSSVWKKDLGRIVVLNEPYGSTEGLEKNSVWLVYASKSEDDTLRFERGCCSRTKPFSVATKQGDLEAFKKMREKPKKVIDVDGGGGWGIRPSQRKRPPLS